MAFIPSAALPSRRRRRRTHSISAAYLPPERCRVSFETPKRGNFGAVFFGQYDAMDGQGSTDIVVKCPVETSLGRQLYDMERYTNMKVGQRLTTVTRFAEFVGEIIISPQDNVPPDLAPLGLVWRRVGNGDTMEDYLNSVKISALASALGTIATANPLRSHLATAVLLQLALVLQDLETCGIVHRDIKPANLLVVPGDQHGAPFKAIDFGSSCDWGAPFKKGLGLATCDPVYTAPEKRLDIFAPGFRFDVYSIGLITMRCMLPSLTEKNNMDRFVADVLNRSKNSFTLMYSAVSSGRIPVSSDLKSDIDALGSPKYEAVYALLASILTPDPKDRAKVTDILNSRFLRAG